MVSSENAKRFQTHRLKNYVCHLQVRLKLLSSPDKIQSRTKRSRREHISGNSPRDDIVPWRGLPQRNVERGRLAVVAIWSTGSCRVGGRNVFEPLKVFDLDVRNAHLLISRRWTSLAPSRVVLQPSQQVFFFEDDDCSTSPGLESPSVRSTTSEAPRISTFLDTSIKKIGSAG